MKQESNIIELNIPEIHADLKTVLGIIECSKDSPVYDETVETYNQLLDEVANRIDARGAISFDTCETTLLSESIGDSQAKSPALKPGDDILYEIITIGKRNSELSNSFFSQGDYLSGMIVDAMADSFLFDLGSKVESQISEECRKRGFGIEERLEAPNEIPMIIQKYAFDSIGAGTRFGMSISSGYMYRPVKSSCQVYKLTHDISMKNIMHDCSKCPKTDCALRDNSIIRLTVRAEGGDRVCICHKGQTVMEVLNKNGFALTALCGGNGTCGKCGIQLIDGSTEITSADKIIFSSMELSQGMRLGCKAVLTGNIVIRICGKDESDMDVTGLSRKLFDLNDTGKNVSNSDQEAGKTAPESSQEAGKKASDSSQEFGIAIDIGTTTLALSLIDCSKRTVIDTYTALNHQRTYGADVISRIKAANDGLEDVLQKTVQNDLLTGIKKLLSDNGIENRKLKRIAIAGNTTMEHLLEGYSCSELGVYPFTPVSIRLDRYEFINLFKGTDTEELNPEVYVLPGISAFVGADIVSGLAACGFDRNDKICLLIDLGTNGEMAIGNKNRIMVTSTAAGPAFEGGNIKFGTGSIPGAISSVKISGKAASVKTIMNAKPLGICGTGVIETVDELLKNNLIDETGLMDDEFFDEGFMLAQKEDGQPIVFTQKDVREIQLAKSAIRAGIEVLLLRYGVSYEEIDRVYIAGGFGFHLDLDKAAGIGMLPEQLAKKSISCGNSSLAGAVMFLDNLKKEKVFEGIIANSEEIELSSDKNFNDLYMDHMMFGDDETDQL